SRPLATLMLVPYTTLFRSGGARAWLGRGLGAVAYALARAVVVGVAVAGVASAILPPAQRIPTLAEILAAGTDAPVVALVAVALRSEEHTSELQSREKIV